MKNDGQDMLEMLECGCVEGAKEGKGDPPRSFYINEANKHEMTSLANPFEQRATKKYLSYAPICYCESGFGNCEVDGNWPLSWKSMSKTRHSPGILSTLYRHPCKSIPSV